MTEPQHAAPGASHPAGPGAPHPTGPAVPQPVGAGAPQPADPGAPHQAAPDTRRRRLLFRATHRGTFENDLMIGGFVRAHLASLTETDVEALEVVMEMPDTVLADWLTGRIPIPAEEDTPMLRRMRDFLAR